ncbi:hypothetical protein RB653_006635 [Dictyostelium firmibasis]|uniref:Uncharacterized protein n=1 Tax=Dictyostelium firmibasis TaxID=79012 RepID=A0AAN7TTD3_9MYCE
MTLVSSLTKLGNPSSLSTHNQTVETHSGVAGGQMGDKSQWVGMGRPWGWGSGRPWGWGWGSGRPWGWRGDWW